jgi:hypothetical protein
MLDGLANNADNGSLQSVARSELPRLASGCRALLAAHAPDPPLRVVSTESNPDMPPRNKQRHTNDEEPESRGQQRRGFGPAVLAQTLGLRRRSQGRKGSHAPSHHSGNYSARDGRTRHDTRDLRTGTTPSDPSHHASTPRSRCHHYRPPRTRPTATTGDRIIRRIERSRLPLSFPGVLRLFVRSETTADQVRSSHTARTPLQ